MKQPGFKMLTPWLGVVQNLIRFCIISRNFCQNIGHPPVLHYVQFNLILDWWHHRTKQHHFHSKKCSIWRIHGYSERMGGPVLWPMAVWTALWEGSHYWIPQRLQIPLPRYWGPCHRPHVVRQQHKWRTVSRRYGRPFGIRQHTHRHDVLELWLWRREVPSSLHWRHAVWAMARKHNFVEWRLMTLCAQKWWYWKSFIRRL